MSSSHSNEMQNQTAIPTTGRQSSRALRTARRVILFLILANLTWSCLFGQPYELHEIPMGIYQGFNCGWDSVVEDVFTCDREPASAQRGRP